MKNAKIKTLTTAIGLAFLVTTARGQQQSGKFSIADIQPGSRYSWPAGGTSGAGRWIVQDGKFSAGGAAFFDADEQPAIFIGQTPGKDEVLEWSPDTTHVLIGVNRLKGVTFDSDPQYPLTFRLIDGKGYVYLCGRGTVTTKDGKATRLGFDDSVDAWLLLIHADDLMRAEAAAQAVGYLANTQELKNKVVPALIDAAGSETFVSWYACEALGRIGDKRALEILRKVEAKGGMIGNLAKESRLSILPTEMPEKGKLSYAVGMYVGNQLASNIKNEGLVIDTETVFAATKDALEGKPTRMTLKEGADAMDQLEAAMQSKAKGEPLKELPAKGKLSYAVGMDFGNRLANSIKSQELPVDRETVLVAVQDVINGKPTRMTMNEVSGVLDQLSEAVQCRTKAQPTTSPVEQPQKR